MTYCRWVVCRKLFDSVPSLNHLLNNITSARSFASLQTNFDNQDVASADLSIHLNHKTNELLRNHQTISRIHIKLLHNYRGTKLENIRDAKIKDGEDRLSNSPDVDLIKPGLFDKNLIYTDCIKTDEGYKPPEDFEYKDHEKLSQIFPRPKETLNNLKGMVDPNFMDVFHKQSTHMSKSQHKKVRNIQGDWITTVKISWPETKLFTGESKTKTNSFHKACVKAVHWLYVNKHLDENGYPIYSSDTIKEMKKAVNRPVQLHINFEEETVINEFYDSFTRIVEPIIDKASARLNQEKIPVEMPRDLLPADIDDLECLESVEDSNMSIKNMKIAADTSYHDPIYKTTPQDKDIQMMRKRNAYLEAKLQRMDPEKHLPISDFQQRILQTIERNRVVVIRGAPGCGKSTRTPTYILNNWISRGIGAECNIIVSQPRRVAALSLASRVAQERGDCQVGDTVGHQVRLSTRLPKAPGGGILYCTAGALLRRLATTPDIPGCSHLILDEAHERSADSDAVMTLAKRALELNPHLKIIVMSATIDTELFSKYYNNCPVLDIPGFTFPVESFYLKDIKKLTGLPLVHTVENTQMDTERASVDFREVVQVVKWLHKNKPDGGILVFLPGWETIRKVKEELENLDSGGYWTILPVHSRLSNDDQRKIFDRPMEGIRKIVLATNIAETSITIDDVVYVVDTGIHKEHRLLEGKGISSLDADWVSQSSVAQRRGRAGRVKPGESYHLYPEEKMKTFEENNIPEILRIPLEKTVLDCKTYNEGTKAQDFLMQFPQPPSVGAIKVAVQDLIDMGALDSDERLTALGRRIASFTTHPKISKALVHSTIFKVASPVVDLSAMLSNNIDIYSVSVQNRHYARTMKAQFHPTSDHMALYWLCQNFSEMMRKRPFSEILNYCKRNSIRRERIFSVFDLRSICVAHLKQSKLLPPHIDESSHQLEEADQYSTVDELVKGVLLSGLNTLLYTKTLIKTRGKLSKEKALVSDQGQRAFLGTSSVNHDILKTEQDAFLLYCGAVHSQERRGLLVKDSSVVHPLTVFLFSQNIDIDSNKDGKTYFRINKKIIMECDEDQGNCLMKLREIMWKVVQYYVENQGFNGEYDESTFNYINKHLEGKRNYGDEDTGCDGVKSDSKETVNQYRNQLVNFLSDLLNKVEISSNESRET